MPRGVYPRRNLRLPWTYAGGGRYGALPRGPRASSGQPGQLPEAYEEVILNLYNIDCLSTRKIAARLRKEYGLPLSKTTVGRALRRLGIDPGHRYAEVVCDVCGKRYEVIRSKAAVFERHFCDWECKRIDMEEDSIHQLHARWYIEQLLKKPIPRDAVVHFINDDFKDIRRDNLKVFLTHRRHLEEHGKN